MKRKRTTRFMLSVAAGLIALVVILILLGKGSDENRQITRQPVNVETAARRDDPPGQRPAGQANAPRSISPERFALPFAENVQDLERIEPREPLTPPRDTGPKLTLLHQPVPTAAGLVQFRQGLLRLADIEVLEAESVCIDIAGDAWPCGLIARTAFRNYLRGRALSCEVPEGRWEETVVTRCVVGSQDPAAWLVSRGWVQITPGSSYADIAEAARQERKGIYGSDPRGVARISDSGVNVAPLSDVTATPQPDSPQEPEQ